MTEFLSLPYMMILAPLAGLLFNYAINSSSSIFRGFLACMGVLTLINGIAFLLSGTFKYMYPSGFDALIIGLVFLYSTLFASIMGMIGAYIVYGIRNYEFRKR